MNTEGRIALHRRIADGWGEAYKLQVERQRVVYPDEWRFSDDAVLWSPYFGCGQDLPIGQLIKAAGVSVSDVATMESMMYWKKVPDYRAVEFKSWPSENGFAMRTRFEGQTEAGIEIMFHELDYIETNADGEIVRWEDFVDGEEFGPVVELVTGKRGPFPDFFVYWTAVFEQVGGLGRTDAILGADGS